MLSAHDPDPIIVRNTVHSSPFLLLADHAGRAVPEVLGNMGVSDPQEWERHIAWDIGISSVSRIVSDLLSAPLIEQVYSRLVVDCNRTPGHQTSMPEISDGTAIPANQNLSADERRAREQAIFHPYHQRIAHEITQRKRPVIIALHSFTPEYQNIKRPWYMGILHDRGAEFAKLFERNAREDAAGRWAIGSNEPYILSDLNDYTIPIHAENNLLPYLELEIRQDLIATPQGQEEWAHRVAGLLEQSLAHFNVFT